MRPANELRTATLGHHASVCGDTRAPDHPAGLAVRPGESPHVESPDGMFAMVTALLVTE